MQFSWMLLRLYGKGLCNCLISFSSVRRIVQINQFIHSDHPIFIHSIVDHDQVNEFQTIPTLNYSNYFEYFEYFPLLEIVASILSIMSIALVLLVSNNFVDL